MVSGFAAITEQIVELIHKMTPEQEGVDKRKTLSRLRESSVFVDVGAEEESV